MSGIGGHHRPNQGRTNEWLTPPAIIRALGEFELDPCSPVDRPWDTALRHYTIEDDGYALPWEGRVWMNPPYGKHTGKWLAKLARHGDGIALIFARTETAMFHRWVWERASGLLFLKGRLHFHYPSGKRSETNAGAPSVLVAYGDANADELEMSGLGGAVREAGERGGGC